MFGATATGNLSWRRRRQPSITGPLSLPKVQRVQQANGSLAALHPANRQVAKIEVDEHIACAYRAVVAHLSCDGHSLVGLGGGGIERSLPFEPRFSSLYLLSKHTYRAVVRAVMLHLPIHRTLARTHRAIERPDRLAGHVAAARGEPLQLRCSTRSCAQLLLL